MFTVHSACRKLERRRGGAFMMMAGWAMFAMTLRRTEMPARPFRWDPPAHERHSRNAVVFAFPTGLGNCDLAERSSRVIAQPRLN